MLSRVYFLLVLMAWLISMGWLVQMKVLPAFRMGKPPDYRQEFSTKEKQAAPEVVAWDLYWNERPVGYVASLPIGTVEEPESIRTLIQFENIRLREVLQEVMGGMLFLADTMLGKDDFQLNLTLATQLNLDWNGDLESFETTMKAEGNLDLLRLRGQRTDNDKLRVTMLDSSGSSLQSSGDMSHEFPLPVHSRIADAFSPRSTMIGLHVGQKWTTPVVTPSATGTSIRLVESHVEKAETLNWQGKSIETLLIVYRHNTGQAVFQEPAGKAWVMANGLIVRQELKLGSAKIRLERMAPSAAQLKAKVLESRQFDQFLRIRKKQSSAMNPALDPTTRSNKA